MRYLLDTNAYIALLRRTSAKLVARVQLSQYGDFALSAIVLYELFFGAYKSEQIERNVKTFLELQLDFPVIDFSAQDARVAGEVRADLARIGKPIGPYDVLIAGQARARNLCLVTNNTREFGRVAGLQVEDWTL